MTGKEWYDELCFTCMVCHEWRPNELISIASRPLAGDTTRVPQGTHWDVRYCNDRPACVAVAHEEGPWLGSPIPRKGSRIVTIESGGTALDVLHVATSDPSGRVEPLGP